MENTSGPKGTSRHSQKLSAEQRKEIGKRLAALAASTRTDLKPETIDIYLQRLAALPFLGLCNALERLLDTSRFFPSIPEIRESVLGSPGDENWQRIAGCLSGWQDRMQLAADAEYSGFSCGSSVRKFDLTGLDDVAKLALRRLGGPEALALANPAHLPLIKKQFVEEYNHVSVEHPHLMLNSKSDAEIFQRLLSGAKEDGPKQ